MPLSEEAIECELKPKQTVLVFNMIEQLWDQLWQRIRYRSMQPWKLGQLQVALHKKWAWIPQNVVRRYKISIRPSNDAVIAAEEGIPIIGRI